MKEVYLTTGIILLLVGILTTFRLLWLCKNSRVKSQMVLFLSQTVTTVLLGFFYIYSAATMRNLYTTDIAADNSMLQEGQHFDLIQLQNNEHDTLELTTLKFDLQTSKDEIETFPHQNTTNESEFEINMEETQTSDEYLEELGNQTTTEFQIENTQNHHADEFLLKYKQILKNALNKTITYQTSRQQRNMDSQTNSTELSTCFDNLFLQHAMFTYSFVQGLVALITHAMDCQENMNNKDQKRSNTSMQESETPRENLQVSQDSSQEYNDTSTQINAISLCKSKQLFLQLLLIWCIPPLSVCTLYVTMQDNDQLEASQAHIYVSQILKNPTNISTATNQNEVNRVVQNVYQIITEATTGPNMAVGENYTSTNLNICMPSGIEVKIYMFVVLICGSFAVMLYTQAIRTKIGLDAEPASARTIKVLMLAFTTLWLPSALETFTRIYLQEDIENIITELLVALGNFNSILTNFINVLTVNKLTKFPNQVQPVL